MHIGEDILSFADASCCIVDVVNGGSAWLLVSVFLICFISKEPFSAFTAFSTASASSLQEGLNFFPSFSARYAVNGLCCPSDKSAVTFQYSVGTKAFISLSLSTIILSATD